MSKREKNCNLIAIKFVKNLRLSSEFLLQQIQIAIIYFIKYVDGNTFARLAFCKWLQ